MNDLTRLDRIVAEQSAFRNFEDLLNAKGNYRPSLDCGQSEAGWEDRIFLADSYDAWMELIGDERRAFRYGIGNNIGW